jgi:hypothetical protein
MTLAIPLRLVPLRFIYFDLPKGLMSAARSSLRCLLKGAVGDQDGDVVEDGIGSVAGCAGDLVLGKAQGLVAGRAG